MSDIGIRILAGICGAALFALINHYLLTLSGVPWLGAMLAIFAVAFIGAILVQKNMKKSAAPTGQQTIGSDNESGGKMKVSVEGAPTESTGTSKIGSGNKSGSDMSVAVKANMNK